MSEPHEPEHGKENAGKSSSEGSSGNGPSEAGDQPQSNRGERHEFVGVTDEIGVCGIAAKMDRSSGEMILTVNSEGVKKCVNIANALREAEKLDLAPHPYASGDVETDANGHLSGSVTLGYEAGLNFAGSLGVGITFTMSGSVSAFVEGSVGVYGGRCTLDLY